MAIAYVNSNSGYSGGPITLTGVTAGNLLVAMVCGYSSLATTTLPEGWTKLTHRSDEVYSCIWYYQNHGGGNVSATITNAPSDPGWSIHEYSGASPSTAFVGEGYDYTRGTDTNWDTTDITTDVASCVLVVLCNDETAGITYTPTGTWNSRTEESGHYHRTFDQIVTSTGTYDCKGNTSVGANTMVNIAVFEASGPAATGNPYYAYAQQQ